MEKSQHTDFNEDTTNESANTWPVAGLPVEVSVRVKEDRDKWRK